MVPGSLAPHSPELSCGLGHPASHLRPAGRGSPVYPSLVGGAARLPGLPADQPLAGSHPRPGAQSIPTPTPLRGFSWQRGVGGVGGGSRPSWEIWTDEAPHSGAPRHRALFWWGEGSCWCQGLNRPGETPPRPQSLQCLTCPPPPHSRKGLCAFPWIRLIQEGGWGAGTGGGNKGCQCPRPPMGSDLGQPRPLKRQLFPEAGDGRGEGCRGDLRV